MADEYDPRPVDKLMCIALAISAWSLVLLGVLIGVSCLNG